MTVSFLYQGEYDATDYWTPVTSPSYSTEAALLHWMSGFFAGGANKVRNLRIYGV